MGKEEKSNTIKIKESDLVKVIEDTVKKVQLDEKNSKGGDKQKVQESQKTEKRKKLEKLIDERAEKKAAEKINEIFSKFTNNSK